MTKDKRIKNLDVPTETVDVVLDTDAFNEIDDQFAIAYLLKSKEKLNTKAIYAAPFYNSNSNSSKDGMEKSYNEVLKLLKFMDESVDVYKGSQNYLTCETEPQISPAALDLAKRCEDYSPENPLYVVAIGAITNVASAILLNKKMIENTVVVWLGGHAHHYHDTKEFNMKQDIAAARVVMSSGVPFVQLPCRGVVSSFTISQPELEYWFMGKNEISDYLAKNTIRVIDKRDGKPRTRVIWDVTAVAWLLNEDDIFMHSKVIPTRLPDYNNIYGNEIDIDMRYVYYIHRDKLWEDVINKVTK